MHKMIKIKRISILSLSFNTKKDGFIDKSIMSIKEMEDKQKQIADILELQISNVSITHEELKKEEPKPK